MSEATSELVTLAHAEFEAAVHDLIGLRPDTIDRDAGPQCIVRDSLYTELLEARHGERIDDTLVRSAPTSTAPGWTDAMSLVIAIDREVGRWWLTPLPEFADQPITVARLYTMVDWPWSPHELGDLKRYTRQVQAWVNRAGVLLPTAVTHMWELRAACPACGESSTAADDGTGERVRRYVLQADRSSARCLACETVWSPGRFLDLAKLMGCSNPQGVLE
ncbi:DUF7341 domain-containing protein [Nocardia sp. NPDC055321]